jgi:hypothetical protein
LWLSLSLSLSLFCAIAAAECAFCFLWVKLPPLPLSFSFFFAFLSFYRSITSTSPQTQKRYTHKHGPIHFTTSNKSNKCGLFFFSWLQLPSWVRDRDRDRESVSGSHHTLRIFKETRLGGFCNHNKSNKIKTGLQRSIQ